MANKTVLQKYAHLLVNYCLELEEGQRLYINTTTLAEPLLREVYREATRVGAHVEYNLEFRERTRIFMQTANDAQLQYISPLYRAAMEDFDAYLFIRAPFNLREGQNIDPDRRKVRSEAYADLNQTYFSRTGDRSLKRNLCQFPTQASAQEAGLSLEEYEDFIYSACKLFEDDPVAAWLEVRKQQQHIVAVSYTHLTLPTIA